MGHVERRHPLCPECSNDLVATIHDGGRVCPECGHAFEPGEPVREARPGDWTLGRGLRRAALALVLRTLAGAAVWAAYAWSVRALGSVSIRLGFLAWLVAPMIAGGLIGYLLARRMDQHIGFASPWLAVPLVGAAWAALAIGATTAALLLGAPAAQGGFVIFAGGLLATGVIVKMTVMDEL